MSSVVNHCLYFPKPNYSCSGRSMEVLGVGTKPPKSFLYIFI